MQDGFGNYCLQYVLELEEVDTNDEIMSKLIGHFPELSQQKFSSNVVEKCLKLTEKFHGMKKTIIEEIIGSQLLPRLLQVTTPPPPPPPPPRGGHDWTYTCSLSDSTPQCTGLH